MENLKILLVDDEQRFLETTKKLLRMKGIEAHTAASGEEALEILKSREIHVVVLDVKMPGMDGNETLKIIKREHPLAEVIMLTGHATVDSAVDGLKSGASDYLMKPIDVDDLLAKAKEAADKRKALEEKIRMAGARHYERSPRQILKEGRED
jgi:DNA-binding NtrC family response regulator